MKRALILTIAILGTSILAACSKDWHASGAPTTSSTPAITPAPTVNSQLPRSRSMSGLPLATLENGFRLCRLTNGGQIGGTITHAGDPVPDGTFVNILFEDGLSQNAPTQDGRYSLPLLARECSDGLHWVRFALWVGGKGQAVHPDRANYHLDVEVPELPTPDQPDRPAREIVLGTVSGMVLVGGKAAPDGTVVSARIGSGEESLAQTVLTTGGWYTLTSIGTRWSGRPVEFSQITLSALGMEVEIVPTRESTVQDIAVPLCTLTTEGYVSGTVTHAGDPVPDNTAVALIFEGGPIQHTLTRKGHYSFPLLARECSDDLEWVGFTLRTSGRGGAAVHPDSANYRLDLESPETPIPAPPGTRVCELALGQVSGIISMNGALAPEGTVVSAKIGPGVENLTQTVLTTGRRYMVTSVGTRCDDGSVSFLPMTLSVLPPSMLGATVTITPTQENSVQNVIRP